MGTTFQADTPGNVYREQHRQSSIASNGADAAITLFWAPQNIKVTAAYWTPYGEDQGGHATSYRRVAVVNGGTAGTGTVVLASHNFTATVASKGKVSLSGTGTVASGNAVMFSYLTVGGTKDDETVLQAGAIQVEYQLL
jgi:hypothetical protein